MSARRLVLAALALTSLLAGGGLGVAAGAGAATIPPVEEIGKEVGKGLPGLDVELPAVDGGNGTPKCC